MNLDSREMCLVTAQGLGRDSNGKYQEQETEGVNLECQFIFRLDISPVGRTFQASWLFLIASTQ